jgi:spermidine/putrescine-binding protein
VKLQDLFECIPSDLALMNEDYATDINMRELPDFNPRYAKVVGTFDGMDVWLTKYFSGYLTFAFRTGETLDAFIILKDEQYKDAYPLTRIWSSGKKGYVTALILFLLRKKHIKLILSHDEPLTDDGWRWLSNSIIRNKFKIKNANTGLPVSYEDIINDKKHIITSDESSPLEVILESHKSREKLFGTGYRQLPEMIYVIGDPDIY